MFLTVVRHEFNHLETLLHNFTSISTISEQSVQWLPGTVPDKIWAEKKEAEEKKKKNYKKKRSKKQ